MIRLAALLLLAGFAAPSAANCQEEVPGASTSPALAGDVGAYLVYDGGAASKGAPLVVFLPGTGGSAAGAPRPLLQTVSGLGYRVIFLAYDDRPAVNRMCQDRQPDCSELFRRARIFGDAGGPVGNPKAEAIVPRLAALLSYEARRHPQDGWQAYMAANGTPAWPMIVVCGHSQGAGMAAYIGKTYPVRRVVLFSGPSDATGQDRAPAPWLSRPSATAPDRWWAERHVKERATVLLANAYRTLGILPEHVLLFEAAASSPRGGDAYHASTIREQAYQPQWRTMFGAPGQPAR